MKVSVVVTVLNEENSVRKLIDSLSKQTKKPDEIVIVDGGSRDNTVETVRKLKRENRANIKLIKKRGNRSEGRNRGIKEAKNEIIAVTDAGGYPKRDWLEKITAPFIDEEVKVVSGYYKGLAKTPFEKSVTPYFLVMLDKIKPKMEFLPSSRSVAFRKSVWERVGGYPEQFSHNEDLVFDYNLKKAGVSFYFQENAIAYWYPPKDIPSTVKKFFRFALGDAETRLSRPKIKFIFLRYGIGALLLLFGFYELLVLLTILYGVWAISKSFKYVNHIHTLFWLPVIQVLSDLAVMSGFIVGSLHRR